MALGALFRTRWRDSRAARRQETAYRRIWQAFRQHEHVEDGRHDTADWRSRDGVFAGCAIRVPEDILQPTLNELRDVLSPVSSLRLHPDPFLHIMLQEFGFVTSNPKRRDEWSLERLREYVTAAEGVVGEAAPFEITVGGANAFQDAVFLDVHDRGVSSRLHIRLHELAAVPMVPRFAYLPHLTVGHFTSQATIGNLPALIAPFRDRTFGKWTVTEIEIVTLRVDEPYPPLESFAALHLGGD